MKRRWIFGIGIVGLIALGIFFFSRSDNSQQIKAVKETRLALQQQGFKTDLAEFNFFTSDELRAREARLVIDHDFYSRALPDALILMSPVGQDSAEVIWKQKDLIGDSGEDVWAILRETLEANRAPLDDACEAVFAGPIAFNLNASAGTGMLLRHLGELKKLSQSFGGRAVLRLHDGDKNSAWTNLFTSTRLVTAWQPEATEISHLVRFACATITFNTTWQLLQEKSWSEEQLAGLQKEWESVDFFKGLPETIAFTRASAVATCQTERQQPLISSFSLAGILRSPLAVWSQLQYQTRQRRYQKIGTYEDEKALLLHYRDREVELGHAIKNSNWFEMRQLPGVTNASPFQSKHPSQMQTLMNLRQISLGFQRQTVGFSGKAASAEIRRCLILAAIALERHRVRSGSYPKTLQELSPDLLKKLPADFADGKPLRYRLTPEGDFVLYSIGLDCVDDLGDMSRRTRSDDPFRNRDTPDIVWPRAASNSEIETLHHNQTKELAQRVNEREEMLANDQWIRTAKRQAGAEKLLAATSTANRSEPIYRGRPLAELLVNTNTASTNKMSVAELLTLKLITTGKEPEIVTFQLPIAYDVLTNLGQIHLLIDPSPEETSDEGCNVGSLSYERDPNGNCLLVWNTIYESPGKHALQAVLSLDDSSEDGTYGSLAPFVVSNLCQFSLTSAYFNPKLGATLYAKLPEQNGNYTVEITSPSGTLLKTISGNTTNSVIKVFWDLLDDQGRKCKDEFFNTTFHVILSDSGRSQIIKGP